jgi:acyl-coenzyme A thioesterase PaaI-like protein
VDGLAAIIASGGRLLAVTAPPAVPSIFGDYFAGLEEQRTTAGPGDPFHHCFGCGPAHPNGLRVRCFKAAEGVVSPILIPRQYDGPPGAAHGGIVAAYLDEVLAAAAVRATGRVAVTGELTVRYVKPVPTEAPLLGRGRLIADRGRYVDVEGELEEFGTERLVATARGRFFPVKG